MIETATIPSLTLEEAVASSKRMDTVMKQIRGLNTAIQNTQLGQVSYEDWQTIGTSAGSNTKPWTITHGGTGATGSAVGSVSGLGYANSNIYTTNTTSPWQTLTTTGTSVNSLIGSSATDYNMRVEQSGQIDIRGEKADIRINGKSMNKWMEQVEQRLNILSPNPELEKEWDDLRRLGERYRKLEKKCQEKAKMWEALKKLPKVKP
jgi:hypothetical protein